VLNKLFSLFSHDIGIDLGTANTMIFVREKGITIREPSIVAHHKKTKQILAVGAEAKKMIGKTPRIIDAFRPLKDGVIADFDATSFMLKKYIQQVHKSYNLIPKLPRPKVIVGIPSGVTEVERKAVADACISAGARRVYLVEEPIAGAIGIKMPILEATGLMIIDIGGGTTEIAIISLGGIVVNRSIKIAGDELDEAIINFTRLKYSLLIGQPTAEDIKKKIGSAFFDSKKDKEKHMVIRGRDLEKGLPKSVKISQTEIREALAPVINQILDAVNETIEETPPELLSDILERGIALVGGGAKLTGLDKLIAEATKIPVWADEDPQTAVVRGCGLLLEDEDLLKRVQVVTRFQ